MDTTLPAIGHAGPSDVEAVGRVLGAAFDDDPVINWVARQDERRSEAIELLFREVTRHAYIDDGETYLAADGSGAAVWRPPGVPEPSGRPIDWVFEEVCGPDRLERLYTLGRLMEEAHPQAPPHFYLFAIGVEPARQGGGLGSALIRAVLDRCDAEGIPAYLENSKERNLPFYERHGFTVRERIDLPEGGPPMWPMWREPGASS